MKYVAIIDDEMLSNFRIDDPLIMVVTDKSGFTRGIQLKPLPKEHGVLKDVTNLMRGLYTDMQTIEETFTSSDVYNMIDKECPTIIEADKESAIGE